MPRTRETPPIYTISFFFPFLGVAAIAIILHGWRRHAPIERILCELVFFGYLVGVAHVTMFPFLIDSYFVEQMRAHRTVLDGINLIPFATLMPGEAGARDIFGRLVANIFLGIPFGLAMPFLGVRAARRVVLCALAFALGLELMQLVIDLVYQFDYREIDINDVLTNFTGAIIGLATFRMSRVLYQRLRLGPDDVGGYVDAVMGSH